MDDSVEATWQETGGTPRALERMGRACPKLGSPTGPEMAVYLMKGGTPEGLGENGAPMRTEPATA